MSNTMNTTLASVLLAAAAATPLAANAQNSREDRVEAERQRISACYSVGQEKGVTSLPLTNKAFQQDRGERLVGCTFTKAAGGEFVVTKAYDLADARQATAYGNDVGKLQTAETKEAQKLAAQGGKVDQNGNPVVDTAKDVKTTADTVKKGADAINGAAKAVDNVNKTLKRFGF